MNNAFFNEQPISFEIMKFQLTRKVRLKIKAVILLGGSSWADNAVFLYCITFIEFPGHLKGKKKRSMPTVNGHIHSSE